VGVASLQALRVNPQLVDVHNNLGDLWRAQVRAGGGGWAALWCLCAVPGCHHQLQHWYWYAEHFSI